MASLSCPTIRMIARGPLGLKLQGSGVMNHCVARSLSTTLHPNPLLVAARNAPSDFDTSSAVVYDSIVSEEEGSSLVSDILARMRRRRYEKGHWDAVITDYKEVELLDESSLSNASRRVLDRVRQQLASSHLAQAAKSGMGVAWLPCHAIDLRKDGELKAHVDSVKFSGDLVAGISLLSSSIMRLKPEENDDSSNDNKKQQETRWVDLHLPPLSLYVLTGVSRYHYTHELLPSGSTFEASHGTTIPVTRDQRLSIIFRDAKEE